METFISHHQRTKIIAFVLFAVLLFGQFMPAAYAVQTESMPASTVQFLDELNESDGAGTGADDSADLESENTSGPAAGDGESRAEDAADSEAEGQDADGGTEDKDAIQGTDKEPLDSDKDAEPDGDPVDSGLHQIASDEEIDGEEIQPQEDLDIFAESELLEIGDANANSMTFGVISDTHNGTNKTNEKARLDRAVELYNGIDGLSALAVVGDMTDSGTQAEYNIFQTSIAELSDDITLIASMGNHEYNTAERFEAATGNIPNQHLVVNGYHFITLSPGSGTFDPETGRGTSQGGGDYVYVKDWAAEQLRIAAEDTPDRPVFVFVHHALRNTFYVSDEWYGTGLGNAASSIFDGYPQAVVFSGHIHSPNNDPRSIWQDGGWTAVNTVSLSYFELESGMVYGSVPPNASDCGQGLVIEVDGSQVTVKNYDFISESWIDQTWTFDVARPESFPYTSARAEKAQKPVFPEDAEITVTVKEDTQSATVTFSQAVLPEISEVGEVVHSYRYDLINKETGTVVKTFKTWSEFYFIPMPEKLTQEITALAVNTEYELRIYGIGSFQLTGDDYLSATFMIEDEEDPFDPDMKVDPAELIDVDFELARPVDKSAEAHQLYTASGADFRYDEQLGKYYAHFDKNGNQAYYMDISTQEYEQYKTSSTSEAVFRFDPTLEKSMNFFSNAESAGMYYEFVTACTDGKADLEFGIHVGGSYKTVYAYGVTVDQWHHVAATFDGEYVKLYLDGTFVDAKAASGEMKIPADASKRFYIGCDTNGSGEPQFLYKGDVSLARLYSRALTANEVKALALRELADHGQDRLADKAELMVKYEEILTALEELEKNNFTEVSWNALQAQIERTEKALNDQWLTEEAAGDILNALTEAFEGLEEREPVFGDENIVRLVAETAVQIVGNSIPAVITQKLLIENLQSVNMVYVVLDYDSENFDYAGFEVLENRFTFKDEDVFPGEGRIELTLGITNGTVSAEGLLDLLKTSFVLKNGKEPAECEVKIVKLQLADAGTELEHVLAESVARTELKYGLGYDLNGDGKVDRLDLSLAFTYFMIEGADEEWLGGAYAADFNNDGIIDIDDYIMLLTAIKTQI